MIELERESPSLDRLRDRTQYLMSQEITDDNGLMSDLFEIGYLQREITGYLGAMALHLGGEIEFFVDTMPGERALTTYRGANFYYESVHERLIRDRDGINNALPHGEHIGYQTGLIVIVDDTKYYLNKSTVGLAWYLSKQLEDFEGALSRACYELGLEGEMEMDDLVKAEYSDEQDTRSLTRILRVAAKWKEKTVVPPYDPDAGEHMESVLKTDQAREGLQIEIAGLNAGEVSRDIDIVRQVIP